MILHIILLILKIIGLVILGILALVLLLTVFILMSPAVYQIRVSGENTLESVAGEAKFRWLARLLSGEVRYQNGEIFWRVRAGWMKFGSDIPKREDEEHSEPEKEVKKTGRVPEEKVRKPETILRQESAKEEPAKESIENERTVDETASEKPRSNMNASGQEKTEKVSKKKSEKEKPQNPGSVKKLWEKIKYTFRKICDNIKALVKKKEKLQDFITDETHKNAWKRAVRELKRLLGFLRPDRADIDVEFGFEDPALTGYTLAGLSVIWPVVAEYTRITPDFEHKVLRGHAFVKGKIRAGYAAVLVINILLDKNVRETYRHIRKFKL